MEFTLLVVSVAAMATLAGATIQGAMGFGMNLVTVPALALVAPESLPVAVIMLGLPMSLGMMLYEHHAIDRVGAGWIVAGRVPGTILGTAIVAAVSTTVLQGVAGAVVLLLVGASVWMPPVVIRPRTQAAAGVVSGITGTAAGIGGPPLALLYQHREGPIMRSTLAVTFFIGTFLSLFTLAVTGQVESKALVLGAGLAPIVFAGVWCGRRFHDRLDGGWLRSGVLAFAAVSAVSVVVNAVA